MSLLKLAYEMELAVLQLDGELKRLERSDDPDAELLIDRAELDRAYCQDMARRYYDLHERVCKVRSETAVEYDSSHTLWGVAYAP